MLPLEGVLNILNQGEGYKPLYPFLVKWRDIFYRTSVHISGVCPSFCNLRYEKDRKDWTGWDSVIYPAGWRTGMYDTIFDLHLLSKFPRESDIIRQWRKSQYRPVQQAPFSQAIDKIVGTIFADSNYSLRVDNTADDEYVNGDNFNGKSLVGYISEKFQTICEDPNSLFFVVPEKAYYETDGEIKPVIYNVPTRNIIDITDDEAIFFYTDFAWVINNLGYFRFKKDDQGKWYNYDGAYGGYFAHMRGDVPKHFAGGVWNTQGFFESYLRAGLPYADEFVGVKSDQQLVDKEASHPFIQATSTDCPDCNKTGTIYSCSKCRQASTDCICDSQDNIGLTKCRRCDGGGQIQSWNPAEWKIVPKEDAQLDHIKIINPDVNINKNHAERVKQVYLSLKESLHLWYIEQAQSGKAKEKDLEGQYIFMQKVSDGLFGLIEKLLRDILALRHTTTVDGKYSVEIPNYVIVKPTQFALKTEYDLLDEYDLATKSGVPDFFKTCQLEMLTDKLYGGNKAMLRKVCLINQMDCLAVTKEGDKIIKLTNGAVSKREYQFSTVLPNILDSIIREMGADMFCEATYNEIKAKVDTAFALVPEIQTVAEKTLLKETAPA